MALHEPTITVTCDGCGNEETVEVSYMYHSYSERSGFFDIETTLDNLREAGWGIGQAPDECDRIDDCPNCTTKVECGDCGERVEDYRLNDDGICDDCALEYCKICGNVEVTEAQNFTCPDCAGQVRAMRVAAGLEKA